MIQTTNAPRRAVFEWTVRRLYEKIFGGELLPGAKVRELDVTAELGVSRSPVREALRRLEEDGLLTSDQKNGWREVVEFKIKDLEEVYLIRAELEGLAIEAATDQITNEVIEEARRLNEAMMPPWPGTLGTGRDFEEDFAFHRVLCRPSNMRRLLTLLERIWLQNQVMLIQFDKAAVAASDEEIAQVRLEHDVVLSALYARNAKAARTAMTTHLWGGATRRAIRARLIDNKRP